MTVSRQPSKRNGASRFHGVGLYGPAIPGLAIGGILSVTLLISGVWLSPAFLLPGLIVGYLSAQAAWFFRDPERVSIDDARAMIAPADGIVCQVDQVGAVDGYTPDSGAWTRIGVFMDLLDVHINRAPASGRIASSKHILGSKKNANAADAPFVNERRYTEIICRHTGQRLLVLQIAGLVARRIVSFVEDGQTIEAGARIGLIKFGSRVDLLIDGPAELLVREGQRVRAGETVLTYLAHSNDSGAKA